jgi:hypothetical protein
MKIQITKADLLRGETINPGWYKAEIISFVAKQPKTGAGNSMNYVPTFKLPELDDRELPFTFNSQAIGRMGPMIAALRDKPLTDIVKALESGALDFDTDEAIGAKLYIHIVNEPYEGRLTNKVDNYLPITATIPF